jgi:methyl-accepting chemotaxis protein-1 (serine sensor receptor)
LAFSPLQLSSSFLLTASLRDAQRNEQHNQLAYQQQEAGSGARHWRQAICCRSGVWFMQDKETGSDGSWHSLMDEAQRRSMHLSRRGKPGWLNRRKMRRW